MVPLSSEHKLLWLNLVSGSLKASILAICRFRGNQLYCDRPPGSRLCGSSQIISRQIVTHGTAV